jgi:hypothetical protein
MAPRTQAHARFKLSHGKCEMKLSFRKSAIRAAALVTALALPFAFTPPASAGIVDEAAAKLLVK